MRALMAIFSPYTRAPANFFKKVSSSLVLLGMNPKQRHDLLADLGLHAAAAAATEKKETTSTDFDVITPQHQVILRSHRISALGLYEIYDVCNSVDLRHKIKT